MKCHKKQSTDLIFVLFLVICQLVLGHSKKMKYSLKELCTGTIEQRSGARESQTFDTKSGLKQEC